MLYARISIVLCILQCGYARKPDNKFKKIIKGKYAPFQDWSFLAIVLYYPYGNVGNPRAVTNIRTNGVFVSLSCVLTDVYAVTEHSDTTPTKSDASKIGIGFGSREHKYLLKQRCKAIAYSSDYDSGDLVNSIAIIILREPVSSTKVQVAPLPLKNERASGDTWCKTAGWGRITTPAMKEQYSDQLLQIDVRVLDNDSCQDYWGDLNDQFCTEGSEQQDVCLLDEGAPLICSGELMGIVAIPSCANTEPSVWTDVVAKKTFITDTINKCRYEDREIKRTKISGETTKELSASIRVAILVYWIVQQK